MAAWILIILTFTLIISLKLLIPKLKPNLPPGPSTIAFFAKNVVFQKKSFYQLEQVLLNLHTIYGPVISLHTLPNPTIFVQDRNITHQALVQHGAVLADRPPSKEPMLYLTCNSHDINSFSYGPVWRLLRRNLTSEMLHQSRIKQFGPVRRWAVGILLNQLGDCGGLIKEKFKFAMFSLLLAMCFGEKLDEKQIEEIKAIQYSLLLIFARFNPFAVLPGITKVVFRKKWNQIIGIRRRQAEVFIPLIRARREQKKLGGNKGGFLPYCYVDSLLDVEIPEEGGRKLREDEIVNLCHEFLAGGTDTTSTSLEWIMAEVVKQQEVQQKLVEEITRVLRLGEEIKEEDLQKMPYLKAVIMEGLRRHPPGHFLLPHRATEDVKLHGYLIPKGSEVHINVAQVGLDVKAWEDPLEFKPERFMECGDFSDEVMDITGSKEIKMMPFGAGRRICPGYGLALLHLEYFVANLVREFEWKAVEGEEVDLTEEFEFTTVMKNSLRAQIIPRRNK